MLTRQQVKFEWTPMHHTAFLHLKEAIIQAPILHYPDPNKKYIVYTDGSDNACRAQLSQEHNGMEFPVVFLLHTFTETQRKWSTTKQEAYGVYYTITKWNYYLQGTDITVKIIISHSHSSLMEKMQITKLTDGVWNSPHTISPLNGFQKLKTKQLIVSHG